MAEWTPTPGAIQGAKVIAAGGFGALLGVYFRHPQKIIRGILHVCIGMGLALIFTEMLSEFLGVEPVPVAAGIGLTGKALAEAVLRWAEKLDIAAAIKISKGQGND